MTEEQIMHLAVDRAQLQFALADLIERYEFDGVPNDSRPFVDGAKQVLEATRGRDAA